MVRAGTTGRVRTRRTSHVAADGIGDEVVRISESSGCPRGDVAVGGAVVDADRDRQHAGDIGIRRAALLCRVNGQGKDVLRIA